MNSLKQDFYNAPFSHIYVERDIIGHPVTQNILSRFKDARRIEIHHYKDVFCRRRQDITLQHQAPMLILAKRREHFVYRGSPVCHDFGEEHFYYTSCVMNCIYDCEYCYLKGMYPSGNLVIFVNLEDTFSAVDQLLKEHPVYLCISYDTDLLALEELTGFVGRWAEFVLGHEDLTVECRTKCARNDLYRRLPTSKRMIFAFTLSPQVVIDTCEHGTASLSDRLCCIRAAMKAGFAVRLCFDPVIYIPDWKRHYGELLAMAADRIDMGQVRDVSVGSFRIPQDYLKKLRKVMRDSAVVQFPFENEQGVYHYPKALMDEMEQFVTDGLERQLPKSKIFHWAESVVS